MKRHLLTGIAFIAAALITVPSVEAQSRERGRQHTSSSARPGNQRSGAVNGGNRKSPSQQAARPGNVRPGNNNNNNHRPGNNPSQGSFKPGANNNNFAPGHNGQGNLRPGNNNPGNNKPGNNNPGGNKPGNNKPGNNNPGHNNPGFNRPGNNNPGMGNRPPQNNFRPGSNNRPGTPPPPSYRPGPNRPAYMRPPARPGRPVVLPWTRPVPPPRWRPSYRGNLLGNILGLTFGVAINNALDNLYYGGYTIDGYMNNQVYLTGVNQFDLFWPDATLFFGNNGLVRSQFFRPTIGYDIGYYNAAFNNLCSIYGPPVSQNTAGYSITSTWFGEAGDYISLQYTPMTSGNYRYFTILTIGR